MKEIELSRGYVALVDDADYDRATAAGPWFALVFPHTTYAMRHIRKNGVRTTQFLHRFLLDITDTKVQIDHISREGWDNRRANLRIATQTQNNANAKKPRHGTTSRFKGVCWDKRERKWRAGITANGKRRHLGYFTDEAEAAAAYRAAAHEHFGVFMRARKQRAK